nr:hypothetical protein [Pseudoalteromonas sp. WY3]
MGGIFTHSNYEYIVEKSVSSIQNAADSFQKKILVSLSSQDIDGLFFLNFPFVGSYPKRFNDYIFKVDGECVYDKFKVFNYPFLNLPLIKLLARFFMSIKALSVKGIKEDDVLIIYSAHLPFIFASFIFRFFSKYKYKIVLFVPDLPEFMSEEQGFLIK